MKNNKITIRIGLLFSTIMFLGLMSINGQSPAKFKYQTIVRNSNGELLINQQVSLVLEVLWGSSTGTVLSHETFTPQTNQFGLVNLEIGSLDTVAFDTIDWSHGPYFLKVILDGLEMGTSELMSVPYALYAENSGNEITWVKHGDDIYFDQGNVGIGTDNPNSSAALDISSNKQGFLPPRMTTEQILNISNPANGLLVFCLNDDKFYTYIESIQLWKELLYGTGTISPPGLCDSSITVYHTAGSVAPVSKTVVYEIVTNIPGENSKCWISSNLGADHQAISKDDASEEAAGWYWQFNLPQGYKHDGIIRTPNTTWVSSFNKDSDWLAVNDPCTIELGNGWRIPTRIEWYNIDASGGWTEWGGPWNSMLKLHAGGFLNYPDSELRNRGISGSHWSSDQVNSTNGYHLDFRNTNSAVYSNTKAFGISLRCVKN